MKKRSKMIGAVVAAVLALSLVSVVAVSADTETAPQRGGMALRDGAQMGGGMRGGGRSGGQRGGGIRTPNGAAVAEALSLTEEELQAAIEEGQTIEDLAEEAGMTMEELREAIKEIAEEDRLEKIAERVEAGEITQEEADWLIEGIENDYQGGLKDVMPAKAEGNPQEDVAEALGLTTEELREVIRDGATMEELFEEAGLDWDAYQEEQQAEREEAVLDAIEAAVEEGTITQEQADWLIEGLENDWLASGAKGPQAGHGVGGERPEHPEGERPERPAGEAGEGGPGGMRGNRSAPETAIETDEA